MNAGSAPPLSPGLEWAHPLVRECLIFGAPSPDEGRSEIIVAGVATHGPVTEAVLKQFLLSRLPAWQVPRNWWFVDSLPANQRGKLSRAEWRRKYLRFRQWGKGLENPL